MARHFDLHRLRLLRELKHRGTISAVATAMGYSHSSVSQQLKILETELGVSLHEPDGRRVRLTPQAEMLVQHVEAVLTQLDKADADLAGATGDIAGMFRIATFQTVMVALMPAVLAAIGADHPRLNLEVVQADPGPALSRLQLGEFDLVFDEEFAGEPASTPAGVHRSVLHRDTMRVAIAASAGDDRVPIRVEDLYDADWVMEPPGNPARRWAERICGAAGFIPRVRYESPDVVVHERLVRGGHAVAFLPDLLWVEASPQVTLRRLPLDGHRDIMCSVRAGTSTHPAVAAATGALHAAAGQAGSTIAAHLASITD